MADNRQQAIESPNRTHAPSEWYLNHSERTMEIQRTVTVDMQKNTQAELFKAETTWFHIFKDMVESGDVAKMGAHAVTVYLVIKSYTNFSTGRAFPAIDLIAAKSGMSERQVMRELKTLEENGYINKTKSGRHNLYTLREKINITDQHGRPHSAASWDYVPTGVREAVAELKNIVVSGDMSDTKIVTIQNLTVNVNVNVVNGDHSQQVNFNQESLNKLPKEMQAALASLKPSTGSQKLSTTE